MDDAEFDRALIRAAFELAGRNGWGAVTAARAAQEAGLSLARARERFPSRMAVLLRFGQIADQAALADPPKQGTVRDRLFYMLMQRFDVLQEHRAGVLALLRYLPTDPPLALLLECATRRSMRWLLEAAGVSTTGLRGELCARGLVAIWLWGLRTWRDDESPDLSATMSAVDGALGRAERLAGWFGARDRSDEAVPPSEVTAPGQPGPEEPPTPEEPPPPTLGGV
jgi:ubiquinone biosynthesis protein COQ9